MIDNFTIERILNAARIEEVVGDFVQLKKRGVNYVGLCPFHDEKTPSFSVSPSKGICKCFSCGKGGNAAHFIMEHEQVSYYDALRYLAKKYGVEIKERELTDKERQEQSDREAMFILNTFAKDYFSKTLFQTQEGKTIGLPYFYERKFREDIIRKFQLGFCPEEQGKFTQDAIANGYEKRFLEETGLSIFKEGEKPVDRFRGRAIFPIHSLSGKIVAFGGRILRVNPKAGKYVNSPESTIYHKSDELYGMFFAKQAIVKADRCYLVEGYTDVISMHQSGVENVVASGGTSLTYGQIKLIHRFTDNITVLYDGDSAGIKASIRGIDMLLKEGMNVKVLLLPNGEDPDSFAKGHSAEEFISYIHENETDFIRFKTLLLKDDALQDPIRKASLIKEMVQSISLIPDGIKRSVYAKECGMLLETDEKMLLKEISRAILTQKDKDYTERQKAQFHSSVPPIPPPVDVTRNEAPLPPIPEEEIPPNFSPPTPTEEIHTSKPTHPMRERELMRLIVRYGEQPIAMPQVEGEEEEEIASLTEYIERELSSDGLEFSDPLYKRMFQEALERCKEEAFVAQKYFTLHPDEEISKEAIALVEEKHQLSRIHSRYNKHIETEKERLPRLVVYHLNLFKESFIHTEEQRLFSLIRESSQQGNDEQCEALMEELKSLEEIKKVLGERLGGRTLDEKRR